MEIILAIVVASAVIFFGALISMGNERQRKAIDDLREQINLWAIHDLRIKREKLVREVKVDDPLGWLSELASKVSKDNLCFETVEYYDEPATLVCLSSESGQKFAFSPYSPKDIQKIAKKKQSRLSEYAIRNPLLSLHRNKKYYELSVLNSGILFDVEFSLVLRILTGHKLNYDDHLWMYEI